MAEVKTEQEPSIEEILESIRQIISEDDVTDQPVTAQTSSAPQPPSPPPAPPKPAVSIPDASVLDLTDKVSLEDEAVFEVTAPPEPVADKAVAYNIPVQQDTTDLMSDITVDAATTAMAKLLAGNVAVERELPGRVGKVTLEDMANDLMRPLIKTWLDQNLAALIERMVQKEIEKISRRAMDK